MSSYSLISFHSSTVIHALRNTHVVADISLSETLENVKVRQNFVLVNNEGGSGATPGARISLVWTFLAKFAGVNTGAARAVSSSLVFLSLLEELTDSFLPCGFNSRCFYYFFEEIKWEGAEY